jgi:hypothetical protein
MRPFLAILAALWPASAFAQFSVVTDQRTVTARVEWTFDHPIEGLQTTVDERIGGPIATAAIEPRGTVTAWQTVNVEPGRFDIAGGIRDVFSSETHSSGRSELLLEFDVLWPTRAHLSVMVEDPPSASGSGQITVPGDASFVLSGPGGIIAERAAQPEGWNPEIVWWYQFPPYILEDELILDAGRYTAHVLATTHFFRGLGSERMAVDAAYAFRLEAMPVPEPPAYILAATVAFGLLLLRRHR